MVPTKKKETPSGALDVTQVHMAPKISIIIPSLNEESTLSTVLSDIAKLNLNANVIVVDGGSIDGTQQIAKDLGVEVIEKKGGLGVALRTGLEHAAKDADIVVFLDADGQNPTRMIPKLIEPVMMGKADVVLGARTHARFKHMPITRRILSIMFNLLVRLIISGEVKDANTIFRAYKKTVFKRLPFESTTNLVLTELTIKAAKANLRTMELSVVERPRIVRYPKLDTGSFLFEVFSKWLQIFRRLL